MVIVHIYTHTQDSRDIRIDNALLVIAKKYYSCIGFSFLKYLFPTKMEKIIACNIVD